jgi:nucleoid-associated protein EbfC
MRGFGNLGGMGSMGNLMKQAQKAMEQMQQLEQELAAAKVEGSAGGGMVKVEATGAGQIETVQIDPQVVDPEDVEMLQDLVVSAVRDALEKAKNLKEQRVKELTGGMGIPPGMI